MGAPALTEAAAPVVSAIVAAYEARATVRRAIDSALSQTASDLEVVVVDDASRDNTAEFVAAAYRAESRVKVLRLGGNGGPARARNAGLAAARGKWIAPLDADDAWHPERLARLLAAAGEADAVFDNLAACDAGAKRGDGPLFPVFPSGPLTLAALLAPQAPQSRYDLGYLKPLMRRDFLLARGLAYDEALRTGEDLLLYLALLLEGARTVMVDAPLYLYATPEGAGGRVTSHTRPRDDDMRRALERTLSRYRDRIGADAAALIEQRVAFLRRIAPIAEFYFARRKNDLGRMAYLFARHASVRREAFGKVLRRRSAAASSPPES